MWLSSVIQAYEADQISVWDIRSIRKPVAVASDLGNIYPETNLVFSPDDRFILTGTPALKGQKGALVFLSSDDLSEQRRVPVGEGTVVRVLWHSRINQVCAHPIFLLHRLKGS